MDLDKMWNEGSLLHFIVCMTFVKFWESLWTRKTFYNLHNKSFFGIFVSNKKQGVSLIFMLVLKTGCSLD